MPKRETNAPSDDTARTSAGPNESIRCDRIAPLQASPATVREPLVTAATVGLLLLVLVAVVVPLVGPVVTPSTAPTTLSLDAVTDSGGAYRTADVRPGETRQKPTVAESRASASAEPGNTLVAPLVSGGAFLRPSTGRDTRFAPPQSQAGSDAAPTAAFTVTPVTPVVGGAVVFDASGSSDPDGSIVRYEWDFDGDGRIDTTTSEPLVVHAYAVDGLFQVSLTVVDDSGLASTVRTVVRVVIPPEARVSLSPARPVVGDLVTFDASGSTVPNGSIVRYGWEFGDGETATGRVVDHAYTEPGNYVVELTIIDDRGITDSVLRVVAVEPPASPPSASFTVSPSAPVVGEPVTFDASASTAPDGTLVRYGWEFGDGETATGRVVDHAYTEPGNYTVDLTVVTDRGAESVTRGDVVVRAGTDTPSPFPVTFGSLAVSVGLLLVASAWAYRSLRRLVVRKSTDETSEGGDAE